MGSFFTNVQVQAGGRSLAPLVAALEAAAREAGQEPAEGEADRTVLVLPPDPGGWAAIYDEATESQDGATLEALGATASRALGTRAVSVLVHDSDVLRLELFDGGTRVDRYDSNPAYFGDGGATRRRRQLAGAPERWRPVLAAGKEPSDLAAAWGAEDLFAERTLARVCELIGCDARRAGVGYRYTDRAALPEGTVTLRFRSRERPAHERAAEGPPRLELQAPWGEARSLLAVGDELRLGVTARSAGGATRGLTITAWGSAIDQGLVTVERFELLVGDVRAGARHEVLTPERRVGAEGEALVMADLPDQPIPAGIADLRQAWTPGVDIHRAMDAIAAATVHVNVVGAVVKPGGGDVCAALVPDTKGGRGSAVGCYALVIDPPLPRPLRFRALEGPLGGSSHLLRLLTGDRFLVAMAAIDAPRERGAALAREAIEAALPIVGTAGTIELGVFHVDAERRPRIGRGKVSTMLRGKRLAALVQSMVDEQVVDVAVRDGAAFDPERGPSAGRWGLVFGTSILRDREEERLPSLAMWADTEPLGAEAVRRLREAWAAVVDRAMAQGGAQGAVLRSGWTTAHSLDTTAYETACGTGGAIATTRDWLTRWVRVPGNDLLWLGPALAARLEAGARERLAAVADLEARGQGLRVALRDPARAPALEAALAALLPSQDDAAAAARRWYERRRG